MHPKAKKKENICWFQEKEDCIKKEPKRILDSQLEQDWQMKCAENNCFTE